MSLENLFKINQLKSHQASSVDVLKLLAAAEQNLADSTVMASSDGARFDAAYKAITKCAILGLWAHGYRPSTTLPGHHQTMIQALGLTLGVPTDDWIVLEALRKKRNLSDYSGDPVETEAVLTCVERAQRLFIHTRHWLQNNRPDLIEIGS